MNELLEKIQQMTDEELQLVMEAVERRYAAAYPEWEVFYLALPRDPVRRQREWELLLPLLQK